MSDHPFESFDTATWARASIHDFFRTYDHPWFNLCVQVPVEALIQWSKVSEERSFFVALLYLSQLAAHSVEAFRLRIAEDGLRLYEHLDAGSTVMRENETFAFAYFPHASKFETFSQTAKQVLQKVRADEGALRPGQYSAIIHYSMLPWLSFTSMSHPRRHDRDDSIPKICMGKYHGEEGKRLIPVSIEVHHALMDGLDAAKYYAALEEHFAHPDLYLGSHLTP
jgi:chloramphenicol O-acetyltransferase type A